MKKQQRTVTKFINYLQEFRIIDILENTSKYDISSDSKEDAHCWVPLQQIWML